MSGRWSQSRLWTALFGLLLLVYALIILGTFTHYGITWDEQWQATYGDHIIRWYSSFFQDRQALTYKDLKLYGGLFDVIAQFVVRISPWGIFETRHLVNAVFGLIAAFGAFKLGSHFGGAPGGFLAAIFLILTPRFYGHAFNNPKDIPFAALFGISLYYVIKSIHYFPHLPWGVTTKLGLSIGLALGIRVGAVLLLGYLVFAFVLWMLGQFKSHRWPGSKFALIFAFSKRFLLVCVIAYPVMLVWWPAAQSAPILQPLKALWKTSHFYWPREVFFEGRIIPASEIPWYYLPKWLLITLPEAYFIGLGVSLWLLVSFVRRGGKERDLERCVECAVLLVSFLFPIAYAAASGAVLYDSERQFLFILPPLAALAAASLVALIKQRRTGVVFAGIVAGLVLSFAATGVEMARLHPYQYIYFNRLFGRGLQEAAKSFETDYWGCSYKEGVEWVVRNYGRAVLDRKIRVASCSFPTSTEYFLRSDRFEYVGSYDYEVRVHPDIFLATARWQCNQTLAGRILHVVTRKGAPLLYIKEVDPDARPARPY